MTAIAKINPTKYAKLLAKVQPVAIQNDDQLEMFTKRVHKLVLTTNRSAEEEAMLDLLSDLIEKYENEHHTIEPALPLDVLKHLMQENGLRPKDLIGVFGSRSLVTDVLKGRRGISKEHAKALGEYFHLSPAAFI